MTLEEMGSAMRNEREKRTLSIDDVSEMLKISPRHLRALEEGDMASLPHPAYMKGFLRSYASFLGFAAEEINAAVIPAWQPAGTTTRQLAHTRNMSSAAMSVSASAPASKKNQKRGRTIAAILLLAIIGSGALIFWKPLSIIIHPPASLRLAEPSPSPSGQPNQNPPQSRPKTPSSVTTAQKNGQENKPAPVESEQAAQVVRLEPPGETNSPESSMALPSAISMVSGQTQKNPVHNVVITAIEECWVHSRSDDADTRQFSLQKGEIFALTFQKKLELKLGNAGGVRIRYDGQDIPSPGTSGQVRSLRFPPQSQQD